MKYSIDIQHTNIVQDDKLIIVDAEGQTSITFGYVEVGEENPAENLLISCGEISEVVTSGYSTASIAAALAIVIYRAGDGNWSTTVRGNTIDLAKPGLILPIWKGASGALRVVADDIKEREQAVGFLDYARCYCRQPDWTFENAPPGVLLFVSLSVTQAKEARVASKRLGDLSVTYSTNDVASNVLRLLKPYCRFVFG